MEGFLQAKTSFSLWVRPSLHSLLDVFAGNGAVWCPSDRAWLGAEGNEGSTSPPWLWKHGSTCTLVVHCPVDCPGVSLGYRSVMQLKSINSYLTLFKPLLCIPSFWNPRTSFLSVWMSRGKWWMYQAWLGAASGRALQSSQPSEDMPGEHKTGSVLDLRPSKSPATAEINGNLSHPSPCLSVIPLWVPGHSSSHSFQC